MHALLAASALHIRFRTAPHLTEPPPESLTAALSSTCDDFAVIEAGHHLSATAGFRAALSNFHEKTTNVDPMLTTCMLLNLLSFAGLPEPEDHVRRWPFPGYGGNRPLNWLRIQLGFGPLLGGLSTKVGLNVGLGPVPCSTFPRAELIQHLRCRKRVHGCSFSRAWGMRFSMMSGTARRASQKAGVSFGRLKREL